MFDGLYGREATLEVLRKVAQIRDSDIAKVSLPGARARQTLVAVAAGVGLSVGCVPVPKAPED